VLLALRLVLAVVFWCPGGSRSTEVGRHEPSATLERRTL
jgi:hypothetical protein